MSSANSIHQGASSWMSDVKASIMIRKRTCLFHHLKKESSFGKATLPPTHFLKPHEHLPLGRELQWSIWKALNRLRSQVGHCKHNLAKLGFIDPSDTHCDCGAPVQNMGHTLECPQCPYTCTLEDLMSANDASVNIAQTV